MNDCVLRSLGYLTEESLEDLKKYFEFGKDKMPDGSPKPPGIHRVIDYLMRIGVSLTPIAREPISYHGRSMYRDFSEEDSRERWTLYTDNYEGLLIGIRRGIGHMAYLDRGLVRDRDQEYDIAECGDHFFVPDTFMVATWQA